MPTGHYKFRASFGVVTRLFRGARYGDPFDPKGPQYFTEGRVLDYSTDVGPFTIVDQSDEGNTATLYSGRGISTDGVNDKIDLSASSGVSANMLVRPTGTTAWMYAGPIGGAIEWTGLTANVWQRVDTLTTGVSSIDAPVLGWDGGVNYTAADWADVNVYDLVNLETVRNHYTLAYWSDITADGLNGKTIVDSGPNQLHGTCTGCAGFTGEGIIPQTCAVNWNKYQWFNGVDTLVALNSVVTMTGDFSASFCFTFEGGSSVQEYTGGTNSGQRFLYNGLNNTYFIANGVSTATFTGLTPIVGLNALSLDRVGSSLTMTLNGDTDVQTFTADFVVDQLSARFGDTNNTIGVIYDINLNDQAAYTGLGNDPWKDTVGSNDGTESGAFTRQLVSASDANDQIDAYGNAIDQPRTNAQVVNIFGDGELVKTLAAASLDTIKTVSGWIWHDGTARTVIDLGTPTVGTTATDLTSSGFTGVTYFVNGASGATLSAGWNHCIVASTVALATDDIDILAKSGSSIDYITTLTVAEALQNFDAQKALYNISSGAVLPATLPATL